MEIVITQWALDSYLDLNNEKVDIRKLSKFKGNLELIRQRSYTIRGKLT